MTFLEFFNFCLWSLWQFDRCLLTWKVLLKLKPGTVQDGFCILDGAPLSPLSLFENLSRIRLHKSLRWRLVRDYVFEHQRRSIICFRLFKTPKRNKSLKMESYKTFVDFVTEHFEVTHFRVI